MYNIISNVYIPDKLNNLKIITVRSYPKSFVTEVKHGMRFLRLDSLEMFPFGAVSSLKHVLHTLDRLLLLLLPCLSVLKHHGLPSKCL